jgi:hypothetical protein
MEQATPPIEDTTKTEGTPKPKCLNCDKKMPRKADFCPHCGQRNNQGRVTMRELVERLWIAVMHLDGKLLKSLRDVAMPARLTNEYFSGRQKRYFNPIRFFGVVMLFFLLVLRHYDFDRETGGKSEEKGVGISADENGPGINFGSNEETRNFYNLLSDYASHNQVKAQYNLLDSSQKAQIAAPILDTVLTRAFPELYRIGKNQDTTDMRDRFADFDSMNISLAFKEYRFAGKDILRCSPEELFKKYQIESRLEQMLIGQSIKTIKNPQSLKYSYLGSFTWTILVMVSVMAYLLLLLFGNQKGLYVEHFLFLLHGHCGVLLPLGIAMAIDQYIYHLPDFVFTALGVGIVLYTFLAMYRYYGQSLLRTFFKWLFFNFCYVFLFVLCMILSMVIVFFLY